MFQHTEDAEEENEQLHLCFELHLPSERSTNMISSTHYIKGVQREPILKMSRAKFKVRGTNVGSTDKPANSFTHTRPKTCTFGVS
jgi:hypothetical protein